MGALKTIPCPYLQGLVHLDETPPSSRLAVCLTAQLLPKNTSSCGEKEKKEERAFA
jgi:hypothetical protein